MSPFAIRRYLQLANMTLAFHLGGYAMAYFGWTATEILMSKKGG